ncbi:protein pelota-like [Dorcoceras hygrometricum]|uniref:Protein pelota-like n=1 Tax=Dorcoceras hygrometricum TaxID=472368 RepID=A0A2Z7BGR3_9LAMI|nr:protein pelota-like [Dorcoceras hygrometricum]
MAPSVPRTRAAAALRMKQIALDNQDRTIRRLRVQLATGRRGLATMNKELEDTQVALEASHKVIAGLTEIGLSMSKKIEKMKVKKQQVRANHVECHQKFQARIHEAKDSMQAQHLIIEALVDEKDSLLQTIHGITDSACNYQLVVVSVQYGPFNPYIPIRSTTIGKSRVAIDPIAMRTSWRSNSDIESVTSIGYPRMSASGESSTTMHRLLHASGSHPIPPPDDPKCVGKRVKVRRLSCRVSMTFRVVRTNQYNQDLGLIHSTKGNHLENPNEGSSIDHQVTIYLHAQNITMFPTNETWYFASQILVSSSGGLILILTVQSTRN